MWILVKVILAVMRKQLKAVVAKKAHKWLQLIGFEPMTASEMYQLSYEASLGAGHERVQFIPVI